MFVYLSSKSKQIGNSARNTVNTTTSNITVVLLLWLVRLFVDVPDISVDISEDCDFMGLLVPRPFALMERQGSDSSRFTVILDLFPRSLFCRALYLLCIWKHLFHLSRWHARRVIKYRHYSWRNANVVLNKLKLFYVTDYI